MQREGRNMAKRIFLVDTENVSAAWVGLLPIIGKTDELILLYTENTPHISYPHLEEVLPYCDRLKMMRCGTGTNALDFQLSSYMGYLMKTNAKTQFYIISNDTGYDPLIPFWGKRDRTVIRMHGANISKFVKDTLNPPEKKNELATVDVKLPAVAVEHASPITGESSGDDKASASETGKLPGLSDEELERRSIVLMTCTGYTKKAKTYDTVMEVLNRHTSPSDDIFSDLAEQLSEPVATAVWGKLKKCLDDFYN